MRSQIDELLAQDEPLPEILEQIARLGAQLLMQAALEADITEFLGRERHQRAAACEDARPAPVTGTREVTVKTTAGPVILARPKLRATTARPGQASSRARLSPSRPGRYRDAGLPGRRRRRGHTACDSAGCHFRARSSRP